MSACRMSPERSGLGKKVAPEIRCTKMARSVTVLTMAYSKMNSKSRKKNKPSVLVVTCDAGGAEVIAAYVKKHAHEKNFHSYVAGPAVRIFRRLELPFHLIEDRSEEHTSELQS